MGPSKTDADTFKNSQHTHHALVVKFVGGIGYRGFLFSQGDCIEAADDVCFKESILNTFCA